MTLSEISIALSMIYFLTGFFMGGARLNVAFRLVHPTYSCSTCCIPILTTNVFVKIKSATII